MAILSKIRRWYFRDQFSIREITRRTGFSRNTVRHYLRNEIVEPVYPQRLTPSKLDAFADKLTQWLADEARVPKKQRRTVKQMHADLCALGFDGSYDRVAVFARHWRRQQLVQKQVVRAVGWAEYNEAQHKRSLECWASLPLCPTYVLNIACRTRRCIRQGEQPGQQKSIPSTGYWRCD